MNIWPDSLTNLICVMFGITNEEAVAAVLIGVYVFYGSAIVSVVLAPLSVWWWIEDKKK